MFGFTAAPGLPLGTSALRGRSVQTRCQSAVAARCAFRNTPQRLAVFCGRRGPSSRDYRRRGDGRRPNRVGELIRREMSSIIDDAFARAFHGEGSAVGVIVSVVDVKCSDDLRNARVSVSVLGSEDQKDTALQWLRGAKKELRFELAQCVRLKYIPELSFTESEVAQAVNTVNILNRLAEEREEKNLTHVREGLEVREPVPVGALSVTEGQGLDLDASAEDAIILDDLDGVDDEDDEAIIIDVTEDDEDLEEMDDERLRSVLYNTLGNEDFAR